MKYQLRCKKCGRVIGDLHDWFDHDQQCDCGSNHAEVEYAPEVYQLMSTTSWAALQGPSALDLYFDFLPLEHRENIVSFGEGTIPLERWGHLEQYAAEEYGVTCRVYVYRNDLNQGSGSFKDIGASLAASALKEHGVKEYCIASTGNAASAYAVYLAKAGICCHIFLPHQVNPRVVDFIRDCGQPVYISDGGYGQAKQEAADFHRSHGVMISPGNVDPLRVESKRTMVFEFLRQLGQLPSVYMQAVAGGTGPIALDKGIRDLQHIMPSAALPRLILAQQDLCDPMVRAWEWAEQHHFPQGYEQHYTPLDNVTTRIAILTAANPGMYPVVAPMVKRSEGTFVRVKEADLPRYGHEMQQQRGMLMGAAAMVCYAGFYEALCQGAIRQGDCVVLNTGEGSARCNWFPQEVARVSGQ